MTRSTTSPFSVNLTALPTRFVSTCRSRPGSPRERVRHVVPDQAQELEPLGVRGLGEGAEHLAHGAPQVEVDLLEVDAAGLDLREVEDVVDDLEQRPPRLVDHLGVLALLGGERRVEQQAGHADDAVHRRADLVAHVGHELRLEPRGLERRLARAHQHVDALRGEHHAGDVAVLVAPRVHGPAHEHGAAVLARERVFGLAHDLARERALEDRLYRSGIAGQTSWIVRPTTDGSAIPR